MSTTLLLLAHITLALICLPLMLAAILSEMRNHAQTGKRLAVASGSCLVGLFGSGTILIIVGRGRMLSACLEGLGYAATLSLFYIVYRNMTYRHLAPAISKRRK